MEKYKQYCELQREDIATSEEVKQLTIKVK